MKVRLRSRFAVLVVAVMALCACAADQTPGFLRAGSDPYPPAGLDHRVASSHVELYWKCTRDASGLLQLDGIARNPGEAQPVRFLVLELAGLDARDREVSSASGAVPNFMLGTNQTSPFRIILQPTGSEVRFDLFYQYVFEEPEMDVALVPVALGPHLASTQRFMVRDACSDTLHKTK
jgi:hypothetical protein